MRDCEKYLDMISAYADDELNNDEKAELEAHLAVCEECRSLLDAYREISNEMAFDTEEVPEGFSKGVMKKVSSYEKNVTARVRKKNIGIAGRWIGIAACIAIVLVAFPRMPHLGCGASKDAAADAGSAAIGDWDEAMPEAESSTTGCADGDTLTDCSNSAADTSQDDAYDYFTDASPSEGFGGMGAVEESDAEDGKFNSSADIGMTVTVYSTEIPDELLNSEYTVTYYENGDIEYIVPVSFARKLMHMFENAEAEVLDCEIDNMSARIIFTK